MNNILFLTPELPFPPYNGGRVKSWHLVRYLQQHYKLSVGSILKGEDEKHLEKFQELINLHAFYYNPVHRPRSIINLIISYLKNQPLNIYRTYSKTFQKTIAEQIYNYDLVFVDHYEVFQYIPKDYQGAIILHQHNAYYKMWQRYAESGKGILERIIAFLEAKRVQYFEKKYCDRANIILAASNDIENLVAIGVDRNKCQSTLHLGDESNLYAPELAFENTEENLLYIGLLSWEANKDGLLWFLKETWPLLTEKHPQLTLTIIGKGADAELIKVAQHYSQIQLLGFVEDLEPYMQKARIFIAPLRFGAGIKVKVLSAMARGLPVVTTQIGAEGLEVESEQQLIIANQAKETIEAIDKLLYKKALWNNISQQSRQIVKEKYNWDKVLADVGSAIEQVV